MSKFDNSPCGSIPRFFDPFELLRKIYGSRLQIRGGNFYLDNLLAAPRDLYQSVQDMLDAGLTGIRINYPGVTSRSRIPLDS